MKTALLKQDNYIESKWSGGNTRQLAIYPESSNYLDRDFLWRLSSADSDLEESSFTKLPDFDRILMVLDGEVVLAHGQERSVSLKQFEQDAFDGAIKTKCFGSLKKDYNLIMRKGCKGRMELVEPVSDAKAMTLTRREIAPAEDGGESVSYGVFCVEGYAVVNAGGKTTMVKPDEQFIMHLAPTEETGISIMGEGKCIFTEVIYASDELVVEEIPDAKASFADYKAALKLFLSANRWNQVRKKTVGSKYWLDPPLHKALRKLQKYYVTFIAWVILIALGFATALIGASVEAIAGIIIGLTVIHLFVVAPLIYMIRLPKPINAHIKRVEDLNKAEFELYRKQMAEDPRFEKLMSKYKSSDEDYFADESSPLYKFMKKK